MITPPIGKPAAPSTAHEPYQLLFFAELLGQRICAGKFDKKVGKLTDLAFRLAEPYPDAVGLYIEHSGGRPNEFIPWDKVIKIEEDAIFITPNENGLPYPPFVDQKGWLLLNDQMMGRTILDMDGRRTEVVNDIQLLYSKGRMIIVHVDTSFNGFLRKWGLGRLKWNRDQFISWRYVQPLSLEDAAGSDVVSLSIARKQIEDLPGEDLADALEELSGKEQQAIFSALDSEKAAEVLAEAEPRAQRQLIATVREGADDPLRNVGRAAGRSVFGTAARSNGEDDGFAAGGASGADQGHHLRSRVHRRRTDDERFRDGQQGGQGRGRPEGHPHVQAHPRERLVRLYHQW
jgi:sporulation protein YlmC with PRC-barrel domain